ncbi:hypothetical protein H5410_030264 [Solanum commersonii]|uniref:NB-ARC domain-containing protein n=1 Tax=Solanum commersonii TaxID=4109 RepID=A0A9J5YIT7_SOLCO|nr:hypothetical protein H5410_030264 [Solanum commersonii]
MPRIVTIDYNREFFGLNNFVLFDSNKKRHSGKHVYSLTINGDEQDDSVADTFQLRHLRLLRVLHLYPSFIKVKDSLLNEICMLNHLRFLSIGIEAKYLPLSFSNLWNLEILSVYNGGSTFVLLPRVWDLVKFPNLHELVFVIMESWDYSTGKFWSPKLDFLTELKNFTGEEWNMGEEDTFENLKCLKLDEVTLAKWEVGEESFPVLEKLQLQGCYKLEEIPPSLGDIYSLSLRLCRVGSNAGRIEVGFLNINAERGRLQVSFSALHKDVVNVLDIMERLKNEEDQNVVDVADIERLKLELAFICTYVQLSYSDLEQFEEVMTVEGQDVETLNVCGNMKDFHVLIVNDCIEHKIVEYVLPLFQLMAEMIGHFLWDDQIIDGESQVFKLAHLLMKIIPIELEVMNICFTNLKDSTSAEVGHFIKQLLETSPNILWEYLIHLQEHMDFIHHDKLFDLLARVGALNREVTTLVCDFEEKLSNKESTDETNRATLKLLENIELLKDDLKHVYLKVPDSSQCCFPMCDGPLFMHLLHIHLNDLLDSNAYSIALIKEQIGLMKLIKEEVSDLHEKIPKSRGLIVVNSPKKPVKNNSSPAGKMIVGFEEETNWLMRKLTSGPADLDVISITGMPSSGKTTLAYKVYNDKSISSHFDLRAWCTVDQEHDEKKLLVKLYNQVIGSDLKFSEDIDVADLLRRQLFGKRRKLGVIREKESCPDELLDVGKEIAENCKGLPLVVDLISGVIAGREKKKTVWLEVLNNLHSFILKNEVEVMKVIEISYDHLPDHLKPCLLHFASRPKDSAITIYELKDVWFAEGFVEKTEMKSMEEVVKIYVGDLISSSLVICFNDIGDDPTCKIHDLVHDFCLIKAREEKLFDLISSSAPSDMLPRQITIDDDEEHFGLNLVLFGSDKKRHSGKHLHSLTIHGDQLDDRLYDTFHLRHLRLLRVLYLDPSFTMVNDSLLNEICMLNHLRNPVGSNEESTLILLPRIWDLVKLRVLYMHAYSFVDMDSDESILIAEDTKLENLRYLENLKVSYSKDTEHIFERLPNLQVLAFDIKESCDYSTEQYWLLKLDFLTELEELNVGFESSNTNVDSGSTNRPRDCHFPSSLQKLSLASPQLEVSAMKIKEYTEDMRGGDELQILGRNNIPIFK